MDGQAIVDIERPRSATELIGKTFELYRRFPLLFLIFAAAVVVPYQLIVLAITGTGPVTARSLSTVEWLILTITSTVLIGPLVSALHVHAVNDVNDGERPEIGSVARRGLKTLPVVSAAVIVSTLGIFAGFVALIVPGVFLSLRWSVTAQAAALEDGGWIDALKRSADLSRGNWEHIFGVLFLAGLIGGIPGIILVRAFHHTGTTAASFLIGTAFQVLVRSFTALASALLFFDLRSRLRFAGDQQVVNLDSMPLTPLPGAPGQAAPDPAGHPLDPASYTSDDRPHGWYIDPSDPGQMRYWHGDGRLGWSERKAKTPKQTLAGWHAYKAGHPDPPHEPEPDLSQPEPTGHPLDPDSYSDRDRPHGWYIVPEAPWKMRYWSGDGAGAGWSQRTAKTPKKTLAGWYKVSEG